MRCRERRPYTDALSAFTRSLATSYDNAQSTNSAPPSPSTVAPRRRLGCIVAEGIVREAIAERRWTPRASGLDEGYNRPSVPSTSTSSAITWTASSSTSSSTMGANSGLVGLSVILVCRHESSARAFSLS